MNRDELLRQIERDPYNEVSAFQLPNGDTVLFLSHRISLDDAVMIRIRSDDDVLPMYEGDDRAPSRLYDKVNEGGDWPYDDNVDR